MHPIKRLSFEAILLAILVGIHASLRYTGIAVQLVPDSVFVTFLVFGTVAAYWALDLIAPSSESLRRRVEAWKSALILLAIGLVAILPTILMMVFRVRLDAPHSFMHDGLVQTQAAVDFVLAGKNPYVETYFGTPLESYPVSFEELDVHPAMYHYVYLPFTFLLPLPFQALGEAALGWFDYRVLLIVFLLVALFIGQSLIHDKPSQRLWLLMIGLNPIFVPTFIEGRNDIVLILAVVLIAYLLIRRRQLLSAFVLALACATKQFAWFLVPFYFLYIGGDGPLRERLRQAYRPLLVFSLTFAVIMLPWVIWDAGAFWEDTFGSFTGSATAPNPIAGFGFSALLMEVGVIESRTDVFPHGLVQFVVGLPVFAVLVWRQWKNNAFHHALVYYAIVLFVFGYFSRYFYDSHLAYVMAIAATGAMMNPLLSPGSEGIERAGYEPQG